MAELRGNKVLEDRPTPKSVLIQKGFGEKTAKGLALDLFEAVYLLEKKKIEVKANNRKISAKKLWELAEKKDKNFYEKFLVYSDFRGRGYCVKTGFKFGGDFRVYPRGKTPGQAHTKWVVDVFPESRRIGMTGLGKSIRLAGNVKANLLLAVVDNEDSISYYEAGRIVP